MTTTAVTGTHRSGLAGWTLRLALLLNGVLGGIYVGFAVGVMPGLAAAPDPVFVDALQRINVAILNPAFLAIFLGAPLTALATAVQRRSPWTVSAAALAAVTFGITMLINVPLNDALLAVPAAAEATAARLAEARAAFEAPWVRAHLWRTVTGVLVLAALATARG